jgi:hypothetical protein
MAAGSVSALAAPQPRVSADGASLSLAGRTLRSTGARIANQRLLTFGASPKLLVCWDEYAGGAKTSWFALSVDGKSFAPAVQADPRIRLRYAEFDPLAAPPPVPQELRAGAGNELWLVQFVATPLDEMRAQIAALGGTVERFVPDGTHVIRMNAAASTRVAALPFVRWVGAYEPAYRLSDDARASLAGNEAVRYSIECMRRGPEQQNAVAAAVQAMGGIVENLSPDQFRMEATLTPAQLLAVAARNEVNFIDPWGGPGGTDMNVIRHLMGATIDDAGTGLAGFTGQGVRGEVFDTEVRLTHQAFQTPPPLVHDHVGNGLALYGYHGSSCYGINFAHWPQVGVTYDGLCTSAEQGIFFDLTLCSQFTAGQPTRLTRNMEATDPAGPYRSCYQTSSVGGATTSNYNTTSAEVDDYLFRVDYLSFQSQSNSGSTLSRPQAWAKNIVSVGGVYWQGTLDYSDDTFSGVFGSASYGPAQEGRIKPDLCNCFATIPATSGTSDTATTDFDGTSGATPITAGCGGLVMEMWHAGVWPGFGGGPSVFADRPFSTTAKAMLINAAHRYPFTQGGLLRNKQGWGIPSVSTLYNMRGKTFIVNADTPIQQGQTASYTLYVAPGEPSLNATMCYIDPMGNAAATISRINDLSLRLTAPDGVTVYWGNNGLNDSNVSTSGGVSNTIDTVENVFLVNPMPGAWTVDIVATQVVADAYPPAAPAGPTDAAFSLVVLGATRAPAAACYANCDGSTTSPCLNVLDFICFLNSFAGGGTYANCDNSTDTPVLNILDFTCFLNRFAAGCSSC